MFILIKNNKNIADFDQFFVPRQRVGGVPGYSPDFARAANQFGYMGARYASRSRFMNEAEEKKKVLEFNFLVQFLTLLRQHLDY